MISLLKVDDVITNPVDRERVRWFVDAARAAVPRRAGADPVSHARPARQDAGAG